MECLGPERRLTAMARDVPPSRDIPDPQQVAVFDFLADPHAQGADIRRCDTHAAAVFLAGDRALKVKRAVRFPFLDYSTLEKRKAACSAELKVNRRFAPQLYRRIVPITREGDGLLAVDGKGQLIEWAVEMTRFDENQTLDRVVDRGELPRDVPRKLASMVLAMHESAEKAEEGPWIAAVQNYIAQNTSAFLEHEDIFAQLEIDELDRQSRKIWSLLRPLMLERGVRGFIRRGHGDLHLGNIAMIGGGPTAFDAIEFDPVIASGDVLYDLAFLLMDLVERGLVPAANEVLNGYFAKTRELSDYEGLAALPFFMSLRAAIRAKVVTARLAQNPGEQRTSLISSARRYFSLALELLRSVDPTVVCIGGLSGTGKSVLARSLAPATGPLPGAVVLRSDVERKALFALDETQPLPPAAYDPKVSELLYRMLNERAIRIAGAGYSAIIDAVFAKPGERKDADRAVKGAHHSFLGLFLTADLAIRLKRVEGRTADASDADNSIARLQERYDLGSIDWKRIDASGTPERTLAIAKEYLPIQGSGNENGGRS
jgi:aminoglycoside phosphotransferase family enzyme/predicted kinase